MIKEKRNIESLYGTRISKKSKRRQNRGTKIQRLIEEDERLRPLFSVNRRKYSPHDAIFAWR